MPAPTTITEAIEQTAKGPASVTTDAGSVTAQSIQDQILAAQYLAAQRAAAQGGTGITFHIVSPPGAA